jgi:hypothetical protein
VNGSLDVDEVENEEDAHPGLLVSFSQLSRLAMVNALNSRRVLHCQIGIFTIISSLAPDASSLDEA